LKETYALYGIDHDRTVLEFQRIRNDPQLTSLLPSCNQTNMLELNDYLIMPVQRLPRYALLLDSVVQLLPTEHVDYSMSLRALQTIKDATAHVNDSIKRDRKFTELQEAISKGKLKVCVPEYRAR
jgi:FYVE/RhoGEF/PH domain-containing protein 5/6